MIATDVLTQLLMTPLEYPQHVLVRTTQTKTVSVRIVLKQVALFIGKCFFGNTGPLKTETCTPPPLRFEVVLVKVGFDLVART